MKMQLLETEGYAWVRQGFPPFRDEFISWSGVWKNVSISCKHHWRQRVWRRWGGNETKAVLSQDLAGALQGNGCQHPGYTLCSTPWRCFNRVFLMPWPKGTAQLVTLSNTQAALLAPFISASESGIREMSQCEIRRQENTGSLLLFWWKPYEQGLTSPT